MYFNEQRNKNGDEQLKYVTMEALPVRTQAAAGTQRGMEIQARQKESP